MTQVGLPTLYQQNIHQTKYARWNEEFNRRETWTETVDRYMAAVQRQSEKHGFSLNGEFAEIREAILHLELVPSMRALMTAGPALDRDNVAGYNCCYLTVNKVQAFDETMYILMCGTGVGFSVERQYVNQLPEVPILFDVDDVIVVADSKQGWASAFRRLLSALYAGGVPKWDLSKLRPAGARLKTFGGRSSGPAPLDELFRYAVNLFRDAQGRKLTSLECHGIMCKIGDIVVVGGVRRSALLSLSNPSDDRMRDAKAGQWWQDNPHYALANNSAAWTEKPSMERFLDEWIALIKSKSGERGIFSREAAKKQAAKYGRRNPDFEFGCNPCAEIFLRDRQMCNLTEVIVRPGDTEEELFRKVRLATILGTIQATYTDFRYLSAQWKKNCEEERLLGVSLTGVMAHPILSQVSDECKDLLGRLRIEAYETNLIWSEKFGINPATAITCNKPSGNTSELCQTHASGIHAGHSQWYIRTNRGNKNDPVAQLLKAQGVPCEDEIAHPDTTWVFSWAMKAPEGLITRNQRSAIDQLETWLMYAEYWCEHKPSVTISVRENEWLAVGDFVYKHWDRMSGVSFLPHSDHIYQQAPFQEISEDEYNEYVKKVPTEIDWSLLSAIELEDHTENMQELACAGGACLVQY